NGPPLAVSTMRCTRWRLPTARRHWWTAQCSESTGTISAPGVDRTRCTTGPAAISDSLLASASRFPASSAASVTGRPAKPTRLTVVTRKWRPWMAAALRSRRSTTRAGGGDPTGVPPAVSEDQDGPSEPSADVQVYTEVVGRRQDEEHPVEAVEHAAVA